MRLALVLLLATGCFHRDAVRRDQEAARQRTAADRREAEWQAQRARSEAEWTPICTNPDRNDRIRELCLEHRMLQDATDSRHRQGELDQARTEAEARNREVEAEVERRQRRLDAFSRAATPTPPPPDYYRQPRNCTSLVNGNLVTTSCY